MAHHTKDKGDLAVGLVISDLLINGYAYAPLISEHLPFDLIAVEQQGLCRTKKLQIRYTSMKNGVIRVKLANSYSDSKGVYTQTVDRKAFDAYAIYCPDTQCIYYVNCSEIPQNAKRNYSLRVNEPKLKNPHIRFAKDFVGIERIFR